jgi:hypothetical protein
VTATDVAGVRTDVTVDNTVVAFLTGAQTLDQKTLTNSGNVGLANGSTLKVGSSTNTLTTQTAASIATGDNVTSGQALDVNTGISAFTTGNGTGFSCTGGCGTVGATFSGLDSLTGAISLRSTGNFTGTLFALTADQTTAGTVLGISANKLTSGKAIDVQLGALYSGTGAINVRAESYTGTILNVTSNSAGGAVSQKLANVSSPQIGGQLLNVSATGAYAGTAVLNVDANSATNATIVNVSATGLSNAAAKVLSVTTGTKGTGIFVNTQAAYTGNLIDLQANNVSKFSVTETGAETVGGTLTVRGASITGPASGAFTLDNGNASAINIGTTTASAVSIGSTTAATNVVGNLSVGSNTLTVTAATGNTAVAGTLTVQGATQIGDTTANHTQLSVQGGAGSGVSPTVNAVGTGSNIGISLVPKGTGRVSVSANGLDVTGDVEATTKLTGGVAASANAIELSGSAGTNPVTIKALSGVNANVSIQVVPLGTGSLLGPTGATFTIDSNGSNAMNIGNTNATTLTLGRTGQTQVLAGNVTIGGTLTGPASGAFTIDNGNGSAISIGGATATTLNLGRSNQTQALLGNAAVAGTLIVTGAATLNTGLTVTGGNANLGTTSSGPVHIETRQTTAPTVAVGAGSGGGGSCTLGANSTDTKGFVTIVVGGSGKTASAPMCTITFNAAFGNVPVGIIGAHDAATALLTNTNTLPFAATTTTTLVITANTTVVANGTYSFTYIVVD